MHTTGAEGPSWRTLSASSRARSLSSWPRRSPYSAAALANLQATFDAFVLRPAGMDRGGGARSAVTYRCGDVLPGGGRRTRCRRTEPARQLAPSFAASWVQRGRIVRPDGPLPSRVGVRPGGGRRLRRRERPRRRRGAPHPPHRLRPVVRSRWAQRVFVARRSTLLSSLPSRFVGRGAPGDRPVRRKVVAPLWASIKVGATRSAACSAALFGGGTLSAAGRHQPHLRRRGLLRHRGLRWGPDAASVGAAYLGRSRSASLAPTPGGLGALKSAMIAGFTGFGLEARRRSVGDAHLPAGHLLAPDPAGVGGAALMERNDEL